MLIPWQPLTLAIANRMRDGWITEIFPPTNPINQYFTKHSQMGRLLLWALPLAICLVIPARWPGPWYESGLYFILLWASAYIGACLPAWGKYDIPPFTLKSCFSLACNGLIFTIPPALIASIGDYPNHIYLGVALAISGLAIVPAYLIGWKIPGKWNGTPYGSLIFGAFIGLSIYLAGAIK